MKELKKFCKSLSMSPQFCVLLLTSISAILIILNRKTKKVSSIYERFRAFLGVYGAEDDLIDYIYAIARHESNNFSSNIYKHCNNAFGMGRVYYRETSQSGYKDFGERDGEPRYMGCYPDLETSIDDFLLWFKSWGKNIYDLNSMTLREIIAFMKLKDYFSADVDDYYYAVKRNLSYVD